MRKTEREKWGEEKKERYEEPREKQGKQVGRKSRQEKAPGTSVRHDRCLKQEAVAEGEAMALNAKLFFPLNSSPDLLLTEVRQSGIFHLLVVRGRHWALAFWAS